MPLSIVILAAGQGKRMHSDLPKVLQPLAGQPLLSHVVAAARALDPAGITVVYGHGGDQVQQAFKDSPLSWALQAEQKGTGHALMQAMPGIPDGHVVLVLYGDVPLIKQETLAGLVAESGERQLAVLTAILDDPSGYGRVIRDNAGNVARIVEHKDAGRKELAVPEINTGVLAGPAAAMRRWLAGLGCDNAQGEYYLTDCILAAVRDGFKVVGVVASSATEVMGVNDKLQLAEVEAARRAERAIALMRAGVTLIDPARIDVRGEVSCGRDVSIDINVILEGQVTLGDRVRIGPNVVIRDCTIGADSEVLANSMLESSTLGERCSIGPYARLRPGNKLADEVKVGNFVEMKNSEIGAGSKANHLSYVGDSTVGAKVNIGAGTVTCNYDGVNKHRTVIGDGVFIGSGTMIVAPVTIGEGATIGAGSTITKPAPAGKLTLERSKQQTIDSWKRPTKTPR